MMFRKLTATLLAGTIAGACALPAHAQQAGDAERLKLLEERLGALDAQMAALRAELAAERAKAAPAIAVAQAPAPVAPAPAPAKPAASRDGPNVRIAGFFKTVASFTHTSGGAIPANSIGRDFYVPASIPVGGQSDGTDFEAHAKQTRITVTANSPVAGHTLSGLVEIDFQTAPGTGNQRMANAYNLGLRRGYLVYDQFLAGQEWTNFQYVAALPETTDYLGPSEGTVFARQAQLRYTMPLSKHATLSVAAENPATVTAVMGNPALVENSADRLPDATARLSWRLGKAELSLAGLLRQLTVMGSANSDNATGWGASLAGKLPFGPEGRHDLRFMVTHGSGISRYVGLNLAPDAMLNVSNGIVRLETVDATAAFAALRIGWGGALRSTVMGSYQDIGYPAGLADPAATDYSWSGAANLFYSPVAPLDLGIELRHARRGLVSGASGTLDRIEMVAKYSF